MNLKKKKICLVIPSLGPGGMERVMSILAGYFDEKKESEVHIILFGKKREIFYCIPKTVIIHRPEFKFDDSKRTWHTIKTIFFLRKRIKLIRPQTTLSFGEFWNNLFLLSLIGLDIPKYVADRAEPGLQKNKFQEFLASWLYPKANGVIVQTDLAKKIYKKKYKRADIFVISNPVKELQPGKEEQKENAVLSVGRLIDTKNFDLLIKLFNQINNPEWKLYIVGGDSQKQNVMLKLRQLINELDLEKRVFLTGTVYNVEKYYQKSKVFAFTSSSEGFPNVIGEAMSAGLPIISFDCIAGPSELIENGENGFLIPLFDEEEYKKKLSLLMNESYLIQRMGKESFKKIKEYSIETIAEKFYSLIMNG